MKKTQGKSGTISQTWCHCIDVLAHLGVWVCSPTDPPGQLHHIYHINLSYTVRSRRHCPQHIGILLFTIGTRTHHQPFSAAITSFVFQSNDRPASTTILLPCGRWPSPSGKPKLRPARCQPSPPAMLAHPHPQPFAPSRNSQASVAHRRSECLPLPPRGCGNADDHHEQ